MTREAMNDQGVMSISMTREAMNDLGVMNVS